MSWYDDCTKAAGEMTKEQRQEVLDKFRSGKYSIGDIKEAMNLSLEAVCGVINENIDQASFIRSEAIR